MTTRTRHLALVAGSFSGAVVAAVTAGTLLTFKLIIGGGRMDVASWWLLAVETLIVLGVSFLTGIGLLVVTERATRSNPTDISRQIITINVLALASFGVIAFLFDILGFAFAFVPAAASGATIAVLMFRRFLTAHLTA